LFIQEVQNLSQEEILEIIDNAQGRNIVIDEQD
jgi:hypothetical protein